MTTVPETIPACSKKRLAFRIAALWVAFFLGLWLGFALSPTNYFASSIALGFLIPLALLTTVVDLKRSLPLQNIITIVVLTVLLSGILEIMNAKSRYPSGVDSFHTFLGAPVFHLFRWRVPLLWAVNLLNSRRVAQLALRPLRNFRYYGFILLGLTSLFTALSNFSIEYSFGLKPWFEFLICAVMPATILVAISPWLIRKKPGLAPEPAFFPLLMWATLLSFLFGLADCVA